MPELTEISAHLFFTSEVFYACHGTNAECCSSNENQLVVCASQKTEIEIDMHSQRERERDDNIE